MGPPSATSQANAVDHKQQYRGRNLLFLLIATCGPSALLFLRSVFGHAQQTASASQPVAALDRLATAALALFYCAQLAATWYLRRMLPRRHAWWSQALQFAGLFVMGLAISLVGAIMLESFGYRLWLQLRHA